MKHWMLPLGLLFAMGTTACGGGSTLDLSEGREGDTTPSMTETIPSSNPQDEDGDGHLSYNSDGDVVDCDDANPAVYPGADEVCDGADQDCDGKIDEGLTFVSVYVDADGDGFGTGDSVEVCEDLALEGGYADHDGDCNDADPSFNPNAEDVPGDGLDTDCDDETSPEDIETSTSTPTPEPETDPVTPTPTAEGETTTPTLEADVTSESTPTEALTPTATPTFTPEPTSTVPTTMEPTPEPEETDPPATPTEAATPTAEMDEDGDGYPLAEDCDDDDAEVNPDAVEVCGDGADNDCTGGDAACSVPDTDGDGATDDVDCDPTDPTIYEGAPELEDGNDNDCDGVADEGTNAYDDDGDGYSENNGDCDDDDADVSPSALEECDGVDQDCDGEVDEDATDAYVLWDDGDGDGFGDDEVGSFMACPEDGFVSQGGDCDDGDAEVNPDAVEVCGDAVDNDCDGDSEEDLDEDGDGYSTCEGDCDDSDEDIYPGADELIDEEDQDCDGEVDEGLEAVVLVMYPVEGDYTLNTALYGSGAVPNSRGWNDESTSIESGSNTSAKYLTEDYGDVSGFCGLIINGNSYGLPYLCYGGSRDTSVAFDIWWKGDWYDELDLQVWIANAQTGECALILQVSDDPDCDPVNDTSN